MLIRYIGKMPEVVEELGGQTIYPRQLMQVRSESKCKRLLKTLRWEKVVPKPKPEPKATKVKTEPKKDGDS